MKVLIACEESQRVCMEFRKRGHEAYSCDIQKCSGRHPEWHILENALSVIGGGVMRLQNGKRITIDRWDLIIAHPPCTYLSYVAVRQHSRKLTPENRIIGRTLDRIDAEQFFMRFVTAPCDKIAIENPVGVMNSVFRKPDQIIDPYMFAESEQDTENYVTKRTCLWLKGLPPLKTNNFPRPDNANLHGRLTTGKPRNWVENHCFGDKNGASDAIARSKTFPGIAKAMAEQWGEATTEKSGDESR